MLGLIYLVFYLIEGKSSLGIEVLIFAAPGLILLVVGLVLFLTGRASDRKFLREKTQKAENLLENGLQARGRVTFVDKNYSVLLNEKPIYSIVEFTFEDHMGRPHISRKDNVDSDLVIRAQIIVGSQWDVKYLANNPDENALLIRDPSTGT